MNATLFRRLFLVLVPVALAVALVPHPPGGEDVFEGVSPDVDRWLFVHTTTLIFFPLLGIAVFWLLNGLKGTAATVSRVALVFFLVFYTAYEVTVGVGTGFLVDYANGLPPEEQAVVADAIQDYNRNGVLAEPVSISLILGFLGWVVAMAAAGFAFRKAGASWPITILVAGAALFAVHPPPVGPIGLASFVAAAVLIERWRAREARAAEAPIESAALAPSA
jgi:hypothetical protein